MMDVYSDELHRMCLDHFNEPFISFGEIARCIGYGETAVDCYILTMKKGGKVSWHTCVGGYTWLSLLKEQGKIIARNGEEWNDLTRLDSELTCGGAPKQETFRLDLRHDYDEGMEARRRKLKARRQ